jgi:hypothetical protein
VGLDEGQFFHADREQQYHHSMIKHNRAAGQPERKNKEICPYNGLIKTLLVPFVCSRELENYILRQPDRSTD